MVTVRRDAILCYIIALSNMNCVIIHLCTELLLYFYIVLK